MTFVFIEKNLAALGYFTPSNNKLRTHTAKDTTYIKVVDGKRLRAKATIIPGATLGLPTTADQDKYIALQKIVMDSKQRDSVVRNPVTFSSAELLDLLGQCRNSGRNYEHVDEWLNVMMATTIISEGMAHSDGGPIWLKDRFRVFDQVVSLGGVIEGGHRADKNHVWFSQWQLDGINRNYLLPIELERYLKLKNHIAKALVPHLQIWLYATRDSGVFEKRYDELCRLLSLHLYSSASKIREKLSPSLNELVDHNYLTDWRLEKTRDHGNHKISFRHEKHSKCRCKDADKSHSNSSAQVSSMSAEPKFNPALLEALVKRGISQQHARGLLLGIFEGQQVMDQLEWGDFLMQQKSATKILNPPGFYRYLIKENIHPPDSFETSRKRAIFAEAEQAHAEETSKKASLELAYEDHCHQLLARHIDENYPRERFQALIEKKRGDLSPQYRHFAHWKPEALARFLEASVRTDLEHDLEMPTFELFSQKEA